MQFPLLNKDNRKEFELRIDKVRNAFLRHYGCDKTSAPGDALIVSSTVNLIYLAGGVCRGYFYIPTDPQRNPLFFMIPPARVSENDEISIRKPEQIPAELEKLGYPLPERLAIEYDDLAYSAVERVKKAFASSDFLDAGVVMREARMIKTECEVMKMREDGLKHCAAYSRIGACYKDGMTDVEFQIEIERILRREGCLGFPRVAGASMEINLGSVIAGDNANEPSPYDFTMGGSGVDPSLPVGACGMIIKPGMTVMVDVNGGFNGYQTDMTRCWYLGDIPELAFKAHDCSRAILRDFEANALPGTEIGELYRRAERIVAERNLSEYFMGYRHKVKFIGHGIGIQLNEQPVIMERNKSLLEENMALAIEPKFVIPSVGAVGVENTYIVRAKGLENLTNYKEDLQQLQV